MTDSNYTHLALIVDRSGSMITIANDMNGAIRQLLSDQAKEPGYIKVDITTFDTVIEHPYIEVRPDDVKQDVIIPRGATALNDAIGLSASDPAAARAAADHALVLARDANSAAQSDISQTNLGGYGGGWGGGPFGGGSSRGGDSGLAGDILGGIIGGLLSGGGSSGRSRGGWSSGGGGSWRSSGGGGFRSSGFGGGGGGRRSGGGRF